MTNLTDHFYAALACEFIKSKGIEAARERVKRLRELGEQEAYADIIEAEIAKQEKSE